MSRFNAFLHRTGERLALPKATRSLILVEIASDLEDLFQHYLNQGLSEEEAAARAEEKVDMSDEALIELVRIHSEARGWTDRIVRRAQPFWERTAMALIVLFFVAAASIGTDAGPLKHVTGFVWPILAILVWLVAYFVVQMTRFSDHPSPRRLRDSLATPLFLGAASLVVGFIGVGVEMYRTLMRMAADPENATPMLARTIFESIDTLGFALIVTLCSGVAWFVLAGRVARLEDDAVQSFKEVR
jgi:NADH:ubiquinone oxidoreductase subunit 6 (subunit J)